MAYYLLHNGQPSAKRLLKRVSKLSSFPASRRVEPDDIVIRWGDTNVPEPSRGIVWNEMEAVARTRSRVQMGRLLRRVGVCFSANGQTGEGRGFVRHYRIPIFDMNPLTCYKSDGNMVWLNQRIQRVQESFRQVPIDDDKLTVRVVNYALRTLHALGLDFGLVSIGMGQKGVLYIEDVVATPVLDGILMDLYAKAITERIQLDESDSESTRSSIMIGTDLEMMLANSNGKMVLASDYLPRKGHVGCDDRSIQFDGKRLPLVELRPEPAATPIDLLDNLRSTMKEAVRLINNRKVEWKAGSMPFRPYCTGGHIHFSGVPYSHQFVRALDNYVGLPLMMVENRATASMRRPRYGFLGDVRHKDYGGFEYRTPASFIVDPTTTAAAFCLAYIVALHHRELPNFDLYEPALQEAFYKGDLDTLQPVAMYNLGLIKELKTYEMYRDYLEPLEKMIRNGHTWDETQDVKIAWSLPIEVKVRRTETRRRKSAQRMSV